MVARRDHTRRTRESLDRSEQPHPMTRTSATIALNALSASTGGGLSVARGLSEHLALRRPHWRIVHFISTPQAAPSRTPENLEIVEAPSLGSAAKRLIWEQTRLPSIGRERALNAVIQLGGFTSFPLAVPQISVWQNANIWTPAQAGHGPGLRAYIAVQAMLMKASIPRAASHVFLSRESISQCRKRFQISEEKARIIPIGPDDVFFLDRPQDEGSRLEPTIAAVGDLYTHKRFELIIEALHRLKDIHPNLRLEIAGRPVDQAYTAKLDQQVEALGLADRVHFLGSLPQAKILDLFRTSSVFVSTSALETFGLTPVEAMAAGVPVIASRESAVPEVCGDAASYFDGSASDLATRIRAILEQPAVRLSHRESGWARAEHFSWKNIAGQYATVIEAAMNAAEE